MTEFDWIGEFIEEAVYPASKDDLIKTAETAGAPEEALDVLRTLPAERFEAQSEVMVELE